MPVGFDNMTKMLHYLDRKNLYKINKADMNYTLVSLKGKPKPQAFKVEEKQLEAPVVRADEKGFYSRIIHT
jgi:hypothetical protein